MSGKKELRFEVRFDAELGARVDADRFAKGQTRAEWIRRAAMDKLLEPQRAALRKPDEMKRVS